MTGLLWSRNQRWSSISSTGPRGVGGCFYHWLQYLTGREGLVGLIRPSVASGRSDALGCRSAHKALAQDQLCQWRCFTNPSDALGICGVLAGIWTFTAPTAAVSAPFVALFRMRNTR